jgi:hypothetical protein
VGNGGLSGFVLAACPRIPASRRGRTNRLRGCVVAQPSNQRFTHKANTQPIETIVQPHQLFAARTSNLVRGGLSFGRAGSSAYFTRMTGFSRATRRIEREPRILPLVEYIAVGPSFEALEARMGTGLILHPTASKAFFVPIAQPVAASLLDLP